MGWGWNGERKKSRNYKLQRKRKNIFVRVQVVRVNNLGKQRFAANTKIHVWPHI
jgi:hypothetical protein